MKPVAFKKDVIIGKLSKEYLQYSSLVFWVNEILASFTINPEKDNMRTY